MKTEHPALHLLTDLIENLNDEITESNQKNVTEEMNVELLNVINDDVESVKQWSKMPPISDELYNELLEEFSDYVDATYGTHYSKDQFQATEFIIDGGHGTGFCIGNILKYAQRYGKKGSDKDARKDLLKVMHYALIQLYIHDTMKST